MAPRKPATDEKPRRAKKATVNKKSADKVVKRPARGYHKFRNGLLNVTPKGGEKELAKSNQMSPLLRLPPEIRNDIWKYVLGGKVFRVVCTSDGSGPKISSSPTDPYHDMALLRTCRQIYAEAASMPFSLNLFSSAVIFDLGCFKRLKPHQRKQITSIEFELRTPQDDYMLQASEFARYRLFLPRLLPNLRKIYIHVFAASTSNKAAMQEKERSVREKLEPNIQGMLAEVEVKQTELTWQTYYALWKGTVTNKDN